MMEIEGTEYSAEMVKLFLKTKGKNDVLDLPRGWFEQHLITFKEGYDLGYAAKADADCDNCEERMPDEPLRDPNG